MKKQKWTLAIEKAPDFHCCWLLNLTCSSCLREHQLWQLRSCLICWCLFAANFLCIIRSRLNNGSSFLHADKASCGYQGVKCIPNSWHTLIHSGCHKRKEPLIEFIIMLWASAHLGQLGRLRRTIQEMFGLEINTGRSGMRWRKELHTVMARSFQRWCWRCLELVIIKIKYGLCFLITEPEQI